MIEINLLPKELRVKKRAKGTVSFSLPILPIAAGIVAFTLIVHVALAMGIFLRGRHSDVLEAEWESLKPQKQSFDTISSEIAEIEKAMKFVKKISKTEINWFRLLGGLSEAVTPGVWLSRLSLNSGGKTFNYKDPEAYPTRLSLNGHVLGSSGVATSGVARFMNSLKETPDFFGYFWEVELIDMNSKSVSGEGTMFFRLKCTFPPRPVIKKKTSSKKKKKR